MKKLVQIILSLLLTGGLTFSFVSCGSKKASPTSPGSSSPSGIPVVYIYASNTTAAGNYQSLLNSNGFNVTTVALTSAASLTYTNYKVILISDDSAAITGTGYTTLVSNIVASKVPIVGIGAGGAHFFSLGAVGGSAIGYAGVNSGTSVTALNSSDSLWTTPNSIAPASDAILYGTTTSYYSAYYTSSPPAGTVLEAYDPSASNYYPLASFFTGTTTYFDWGYQSDPSAMTPNGKNLFINVMNHLGTPILYIYSTDTTAAGNFQTFLNANGYNVTTATLSAAAAMTIADYGVVLISDDSCGASGPWGNAGLVTNIVNSHVPVVGLGTGGSYFFNVAGATPIGQINSGTNTTATVNAVSSSDALWSTPNALNPLSTLSIYSPASIFWGPYYTSAPGGGTILEATAADSGFTAPVYYYPLARYYTGTAVYFDWGFRTDTSGMTSVGKDLFLNVLKDL